MTPDTEPSPINSFIQKITDRVLSNLDNEQFGVEELSDQVGMSRSQLHRKLKLLKGKSVSQFIREVRLTEAMKMLQQEVATASEIAYRVGFTSPSYFFKCFQKYYGFPPGEVKKLQNNAEDLSDINTVANERTIKSKGSKSVFLLAILSLSTFLIAFFGYHYYKDIAKQPALEKSIAVLPFKSLSTDEDNQHFTDGLVDDLLGRLALINEFEVTSRTSSETFRYRDDINIQNIANELGVSYIVEGSVQKNDRDIRIIVQLIDAINDDHIWVKTFDRNLSDVFEVQSEIAIQIASGLNMALSEQQVLDLHKNQTKNVKAMELYQIGRFHWGKRMAKHYDIAIQYFEQAIAEDSVYALAYAGIADTYFLKNWSFTDLDLRMECRDKSETYALKALKIDPNLAEAITVLATLNFFIDWDWAAAEEKFVRALKINPNYSTLQFRYAEHLSYTGRHEKARYHLNKAIELDPLSYVIRRNSSKLYINQGLFQEALEEAKFSQVLNEDNPKPHWYQFEIYCITGNGIEALNQIKLIQHMYNQPSQDYVLDSIYNLSGITGLVHFRIDIANTYLVKARNYNYLGENDKALECLEKSYDESRLMTDVPYWYSPNNLKSESRFIALMEKMDLPWKPEDNQ